MTTNIVENFAMFTLSLLNSFINLLLKPIDNLITSLIPSFDALSENAYNFLNYFTDYFVYIINWLHIPSTAISLIITYIIFKVSIFFGSLTVRLVIKWYRLLKQ